MLWTNRQSGPGPGPRAIPSIAYAVKEKYDRDTKRRPITVRLFACVSPQEHARRQTKHRPSPHWRSGSRRFDASRSARVNSLSVRRLADLLPSEKPSNRPASRPNRVRVAGAAVLALLALLAFLMRGTPTDRPSEADRPTVQASDRATEPAGLPATPTATGQTLARAAVAYAAPDGVALGALEPGRGYAIIGRAGTDWVQIDAGASGAVWVRAADLGSPPLAGVPDLAPPTPRPLPTVRPARVAPPAPCTEATATYTARREVYDDDGVPIGAVVGWSCVSQADADNNAAAQIAALRGE